MIEQPVMWGNHRDNHPTDRYKAIVDANTGKLFSIVSKDYRLIRHEEAIEQIEEAISENSDMRRAYRIETEFYNDGGRMQRKYIFPEISVEIGKNDTVNLELQLFNSYDVTWPFFVVLGAFRFVCANGLVVGEDYLYLKRRHVYDLSLLDLSGEVSTATDRFMKQATKWQRWSEEPLTEDTYSTVMESMKFGKREKQEIQVRVYAQAEGFDDDRLPIMSFWIFFNVITWHISHQVASLNHRVDLEKKLRAAIGTIGRI